MRKAAIFFAILVVLVIAVLGLAPQLVDLERLKGPIVEQLAKRTGRKVELLGPISVTLLPRPVLTARDVRLANPPNAAAPDMLRLRALEVKPALLPLLSGRFEIDSATLVEPELDLERMPDGTSNWRLPAAAPPAGGAAAAPSGGSTALANGLGGFAVDRVAIQNGVVIDRTHGTTERFEHINARISADAATRQSHAEGSLVARGAEVGFQVDSGRLDAPELPLRLTVTTVPTAKLELDARLTGPLDDRHIAGQVKLSADDARAALAIVARYAAPAAAAQPLAFSADIDGTPQRLVLDHLKLDLGLAHGEGRLQVERSATPAVTLALSFGSLDLDHWPMPRRAASAFSLIAGAHAATPPAAVAGDPLPDITAKVQLAADAMLWRGGLVRDARLAFNLTDGRVSVSRLAASLPGGADLTLSGTLTPAVAGPSAEGMIEAKADDLRGLLAWLGTSVDAVPADRLRQAALSSRFSLAGNRIDLGPVNGTLDGTRLGGAATVLLRARPGLGLRIVADRLNLDAYLPVPAAAPASPGPATEGAKPAPPPAAGLLDAFDANMDARVQVLTWRGQPLRDVHLAGSLQTGELAIRELSVADAGGANATVSGVVDGVSAKPSGQLAFDMRGPEFERVLRLVAPSLAAGRSYGNFNMGGGLQYDGAKFTLDAELQLLEGHVRLAGEAGETSGALDLTLDAEHPSFQRLLQSFDPLYQAAGGDPGPTKLTGHITGDRHHLKVEPLLLTVGESGLDGTLGIDLGAARPRLAANLTVGDWAIDRLLPTRLSAALESEPRSPAGTGIVLVEARFAPPILAESWSSAPIDVGAMNLADIDLTLGGHSLSYGRWRLEQPALQASLSAGKLTVKRLAGSLLGGSLDASGTADATPSIAGHVAIANADLKEALVGAASLALVDGRFDLDTELAASGKSAAELVAHLSGKATLKGHDGSIGGVNLKAVDDELTAHPADLLTLLKRAGGGRTAFSKLGGDFQMADGIATSDDIRLVADGGDVHATLGLNLPRWTMTGKVEFRAAAIPDAPPLTMRLEGPIDEPFTIFEVNALEQYLAQRQPDAKMPAHP